MSGTSEIESWKQAVLRVGLVLALAGSVACGHAAKIRPTPKGALDVEASFGGPMAKVEAFTIPLPLITVGASYGLTDRMDVDAHLHGTTLAFGVAGLDLGASYLAAGSEGPGPALTVGGRVYGFAEVRRLSSAGYLELSMTPSWRFNSVFTAYLSASALAQLARTPVIPTVAGGAEVRLGELALQAELRWYGPNHPSDAAAVDWLSVGGLGAWGPMINLGYRFGGAR